MIYQATLYKVEPTGWSRPYWVCQLEDEIPASVMRKNFIPQELWDHSHDLFSFESYEPQKAVGQLIDLLKSWGLSGKLRINK